MNPEIVSKGLFHWMRESFLALRKQPEGIKLWQEIIDKALTSGYESSGAVPSSGPEEFLKHVVERDKLLGLEAGGEILSPDKFSYWIKDPFLPLKNSIPLEEYQEISTLGYIEAKRKFFVPDFSVRMVKNMWEGEERSEWIFEKVRE
jgi:hypothetical protein